MLMDALQLITILVMSDVRKEIIKIKNDRKRVCRVGYEN